MTTQVDIFLSPKPEVEVQLFEYRKFGSDESITTGHPDFDPTESPITFGGDDPQHPLLGWKRSEPAQAIVIRTEAGALRYNVSGGVTQPVRVGDCVGGCSDCPAGQLCDRAGCFCNGNTRMVCIGNVTVRMTDGDSAFVRACLFAPSP